MSRCPHLAVVLMFLASLSLLLPSLAAAKDERPNFIVILAEDMGFGDLGCYNHPYARTPNIDRLAAEGTRYVRFYVTGATCNPSRTGLMTSRHPASYPNYIVHG
jgi:N-acetylgalactosamine-6-sulfatase